MKKWWLGKDFVKALTSFIILSIIVIAVSSYFVYNSKLIGPVFLFLGYISLFFLRFFKIDIKSIYPDIVFGATDNFVLVFAATLGATFAGVAGAIIGGIAGNTLTDGFAGLVEGHIANRMQRQKIRHNRTALSTMLGKMTGCLFGAGIGLIFLWLISLVWFSPS
ncbi:MAG TPA: hypothetical protein ENG87_01610 [Candidatus Pacearchaeota archaeon]|nr:hypothetical protein BMS3Abin17_01227 [archaeon BMS3Abin17]HDK42048.1 hypothetical protein [Candidatus Pacearchaeota archaeon]HDZ60687.1 hypothetical protein [Candidatus Pacearchaeota archaeon]